MDEKMLRRHLSGMRGQEGLDACTRHAPAQLLHNAAPYERLIVLPNNLASSAS